jgi:hypothetical protein
METLVVGVNQDQNRVGTTSQSGVNVVLDAYMTHAVIACLESPRALCINRSVWDFEVPVEVAES